MAVQKTNNKKDLPFGFLESQLNHYRQIETSYNWQAAILVLTSGLIFILSLQNIFSLDQRGVIGFLVIAFFNLMALAFSAYALKFKNNYPLEFNKKKIKQTLSKPEKMTDYYLTELNYLANISIKSKSALTGYSVNLLIVGLTVGLILFFFLP
ncbi:MAG TPA: hypothetical protein VGA49_00550 [Patescibacteria group bacterium]